jgi:hypothetical protein
MEIEMKIVKGWDFIWPSDMTTPPVYVFYPENKESFTLFELKAIVAEMEKMNGEVNKLRRSKIWKAACPLSSQE